MTNTVSKAANTFKNMSFIPMKHVNFEMQGMTSIWAMLGGLFYAFNAIALILSAGCLFS